MPDCVWLDHFLLGLIKYIFLLAVFASTDQADSLLLLLHLDDVAFNCTVENAQHQS